MQPRLGLRVNKGASWEAVLGRAGSNAQMLLNGTDAPTSGDGVDGDFWIATGAWQIYGPKASGAWPAGVSMIGPAPSTATLDALIAPQVTAATASIFAALADAADPGTPTYSAPTEPSGGFELLPPDPDRLYVTLENTTGSPLLVNEAGVVLTSLSDPGQILPAGAVADIYVKGVVTAYSASGGPVHLTVWHRST